MVKAAKRQPAKPLSATRINSLKEPGYYRDALTRGLYLQVSVGERGGVNKSFIYRYASPLTGAMRWMGLGSADAITLADARELAQDARRQVTLGQDPIAEKRRAKVERREAAAREAASRMTFRQCADAFKISTLRDKKLRNAKHLYQWQRSLDLASDAFGDVSVAEIDTPMMIKFLDPLWAATPETADRTRARVAQVLDWARVRGYRLKEAANPATWDGNLEHVYSAPQGGHYVPMPYEEVPEFMKRLRTREGQTPRALELLVLTAARTGEIRFAEWAEFDLDAKLWTIPGEKMKAGKPHVVPLSKRAIEIVKAQPRVEGQPYVFPGQHTGKPMSDNTMRKLFKSLDTNGYDVHAFRSTLKDWCGDETVFDDELSEHALAHQPSNSVKAAYRRRTSVKKRARLMQEWADYCNGIKAEGKVVELHA